MNDDKKPQVDAVDYGYGKAAPDSDKQAAVDYGYGKDVPGIEKQVDYGYGDAVPDSGRQQPTSRPKFVRRSSLKQLNGSSHSRPSLGGFCL